MNEMAASEIVFLHTSDAHIATFDALRARIAPEVKIRHILRAAIVSRSGIQLKLHVFQSDHLQIERAADSAGGSG